MRNLTETGQRKMQIVGMEVDDVVTLRLMKDLLQHHQMMGEWILTGGIRPQGPGAHGL